MSRIGVYSGSFDPVHKGHVSFALEAAKIAKLDMVYFAPEIKPRRKPHITHFAHRLSMLRLAVRSQPKLEVLELPDKYFSPKTTLARLQKLFPGDELVLLIGSDLFEHMYSWPHVEYLLDSVELVVALRSDHDEVMLSSIEEALPKQPRRLYHFYSPQPGLSSSTIRKLLRQTQISSDVTTSVATYIQKHWLYHSDLSA